MATPTDQELDEKLIEEVVSAIQGLEPVAGQVGYRRIAETVIPLITKRNTEKVLGELYDWAQGPSKESHRPLFQQQLCTYAAQKGITLP